MLVFIVPRKIDYIRSHETVSAFSHSKQHTWHFSAFYKEAVFIIMIINDIHVQRFYRIIRTNDRAKLVFVL